MLFILNRLHPLQLVNNFSPVPTISRYFEAVYPQKSPQWAVIGSITVACPICMERRSYIVSTEVFLGQPPWEVMRVLQGRR